MWRLRIAACLIGPHHSPSILHHAFRHLTRGRKLMISTEIEEILSLRDDAATKSAMGECSLRKSVAEVKLL